MEPSKKMVVVLLMVFLVAVTSASAASVGKDTLPECMSPLGACAGFFNGSEPSTACCIALKTVLEKELDCFCKEIPNLNKTTPGFNETRAYELPGSCNINFAMENCTHQAPSPPPSSSSSQNAPLPSASSPPPPVEETDATPPSASSQAAPAPSGASIVMAVTQLPGLMIGWFFTCVWVFA